MVVARMYSNGKMITMKICSKCNTQKPVSEFWHSGCSRDGYSAQCKKCHSGHGGRYKRYGIDKVDYNEMLAEQNNVCKICGQPETATLKGVLKNLSIDHNHETGKVRGLLCNRCNMALGLFLDDADIMINAAEYIKENE